MSSTFRLSNEKQGPTGFQSFQVLADLPNEEGKGLCPEEKRQETEEHVKPLHQRNSWTWRFLGL